MSLSQMYRQFIEEPGDKLVCSMTLQIDQCRTLLVRWTYFHKKFCLRKSRSFIFFSPDNKRQEVVNVVEQKFQRLALPSANPSHSQVMFNVEQMGAGGSAIAAAASQAIAATQQVRNHFLYVYQR